MMDPRTPGNLVFRNGSGFTLIERPVRTQETAPDPQSQGPGGMVKELDIWFHTSIA
jgi:hypothetical protein